MYSSAHRIQEMGCMGNLDVEGPLAHFTKTWGGGGVQGLFQELYCCI